MNNLDLHSTGMRMGVTDGCWSFASLARITVEIVIEATGFFAAHYHRSESGDVGDCEIYEINRESPGGVLQIFRRAPGEREWEQTSLSHSSPWVFIPPGWHHGGRVVGEEGVIFKAHTRSNHTRPGEKDGNVIWLPNEEQPKPLQQLIEQLRSCA